MEFVTNNLIWIALALASGAALFFPTFRSGGGNSVTPTEAVLLINRQHAAIVDVREESEFQTGHIPESRLFPLAQLEQRVGELSRFKSKPVVVVCESGARSGRAVATLRKAGFEQACNLSGGLKAWRDAGQPLVKGSKSA